MITVHALSPNVEVIARSEAPALPPDLETEVAAIWDQERSRRFGLVDGQVFGVERFSADRIEGRFVPYRRLVAQRVRPALFARLRVRPLAVSGLLTCKGGVVFGRRAADVAFDPGCWELAPSGGVAPESANAAGRIDLARQIKIELEEEVGLAAAEVAEPEILCAIEDDETRVVDIGIALASPLVGAEVRSRHARRSNREYAELAVVAPDDVAAFAGVRDVIAVSRALLEYRGLTSTK